jgi:hypothetical protein
VSRIKRLKLTWKLIHSIRHPPSPTLTLFGGLSNALRSTISSFPFSVPKYSAAPSDEKRADVSGILRLSVRKRLERSWKLVTALDCRAYVPFLFIQINKTNIPSTSCDSYQRLAKGATCQLNNIPTARIAHWNDLHRPRWPGGIIYQ